MAEQSKPTKSNPVSETPMPRRVVLRDALRGVALLCIGGSGGFLLANAKAEEQVWQLDPHKCISCGYCATECVLDESAVKCVQSYPMCGYCELCTGFFNPAPSALDTGAENQLCPTGAILRSFIEDPYYEYTVDESLCIGCAKCVEWCEAFGNASLYLQIRHDRCVNCNECAIAMTCPTEAFTRVPVSKPYMFKITANENGASE